MPQTLSAVLASLGLPADRLSAAIVSFAKFFSLPLDPGLLAKVRQQAVGQAPLPEQAGEKANAVGNAAGYTAGALFQRGREALALAALAAADKGVELTPRGLEDYAAAIDPDQRGGQGSGNKGERPKKRRDEHSDDEAAAISADARRLKAAMSGAAKQDPLLDLLNRRPGKNSRRWIVFPFDFTENSDSLQESGDQYRVSLRILLDEGPAGLLAGRAPGRLALEILRSGTDSPAAKQRWLFVLDSDQRSGDQRSGDQRSGHGGKITRLEALLWPPRPERALQALARDLAARVNVSPAGVFVRNSGEYFPFAAENRENRLLSINEEV